MVIAIAYFFIEYLPNQNKEEAVVKKEKPHKPKVVDLHQSNPNIDGKPEPKKSGWKDPDKTVQERADEVPWLSP